MSDLKRQMNNSDGPLVTVSKLKAHSNNVWLFYDVSASMFNKTVKQNHTEHLLNYLRSLKIDFVYYPFSHSGFNGGLENINHLYYIQHPLL